MCLPLFSSATACAAPAAGKVTNSCFRAAHWGPTQKLHNGSTGAHSWELNSRAGAALQFLRLTKFGSCLLAHILTFSSAPPPPRPFASFPYNTGMRFRFLTASSGHVRQLAGCPTAPVPPYITETSRAAPGISQQEALTLQQAG